MAPLSCLFIFRHNPRDAFHMHINVHLVQLSDAGAMTLTHAAERVARES